MRILFVSAAALLAVSISSSSSSATEKKLDSATAPISAATATAPTAVAQASSASVPAAAAASVSSVSVPAKAGELKNIQPQVSTGPLKEVNIEDYLTDPAILGCFNLKTLISKPIKTLEAPGKLFYMFDSENKELVKAVHEKSGEAVANIVLKKTPDEFCSKESLDALRELIKKMPFDENSVVHLDAAIFAKCGNFDDFKEKLKGADHSSDKSGDAKQEKKTKHADDFVPIVLEFDTNSKVFAFRYSVATLELFKKYKDIQEKISGIAKEKEALEKQLDYMVPNKEVKGKVAKIEILEEQKAPIKIQISDAFKGVAMPALTKIFPDVKDFDSFMKKVTDEPKAIKDLLADPKTKAAATARQTKLTALINAAGKPIADLLASMSKIDIQIDEINKDPEVKANAPIITSFKKKIEPLTKKIDEVLAS